MIFGSGSPGQAWNRALWRWLIPVMLFEPQIQVMKVGLSGIFFVEGVTVAVHRGEKRSGEYWLIHLTRKIWGGTQVCIDGG
jgi:hypothetical protein